MADLAYCRGCFEKQRQINELKEKVALLEGRLRYQQRSAKEGFFGASTPSSKVPLKPDALAERQARRGGARLGHPGRGRRRVSEARAERREAVALTKRTCPDCAVALESEGRRRRAVIDLRPMRVERIVYRLERRRCPRCGRRFQAKPPGVLPKGFYGNRLLAHVAVAHYLEGTSLGRIARQTGLGRGALLNAMRGLALRLDGAPRTLLEEYRRAPVKHADETGWRTDGRNGYAWLFATPTISLFRFRRSRSGVVAAETLGPKRLPGVLVVDRYAGYNKAPVALQYCFAHLKRDAESLRRDFPDDPEIAAFVGAWVRGLSEAMALRGLGLSRSEFRRRALRVKRRLVALAHRQARHPGIWKIQALFREKGERLYHWTRGPTVPAENNLAERDLRPLVIARKISFGSQSEEGARTRETLMSVLATLKKRRPDVAPALCSALDRLAENPRLDPAALLFESPPIQKAPSPS